MPTSAYIIWDFYNVKMYIFANMWLFKPDKKCVKINFANNEVNLLFKCVGTLLLFFHNFHNEIMQYYVITTFA